MLVKMSNVKESIVRRNNGVDENALVLDELKQRTRVNLNIAVLTYPFQRLNRDKAKHIQLAFDKKIVEIAEANLDVFNDLGLVKPLPSFRRCPKLRYGALFLWCDDEESLTWLKETVKGIKSPIEGTILKITLQKYVPRRINGLNK